MFIGLTLLLALAALDVAVVRFGTDSRDSGDWRTVPVERR
jgi:hypothetical protein